MEEKYALLIDAENAEIKYLDHIFKELRTYGVVTYKRMYGDFTVDRMKAWNKKALEYAIVSIQQPHYSNYKNAADIMLVIDAMDILYANHVDGFCIVSNDSDYTRLVNRLSEAGKKVIGMGSSKASKTFRAACNEFKILEKIFSDDEAQKDVEDEQEEKAETNTSLATVKSAIYDMIVNTEMAGLGGIKSTLQRTYSDFDERNYGFTTIRKMIESMKEFELVQENNNVYVKIRNQSFTEEEIIAFLIDNVKKTGSELGSLGRKLHQKYPDFNPKSFGYSQFGKFVQSIPELSVMKIGNRNIVKLQKDKL